MGLLSLRRIAAVVFSGGIGYLATAARVMDLNFVDLESIVKVIYYYCCTTDTQHRRSPNETVRFGGRIQSYQHHKHVQVVGRSSFFF